MIGVRVGYPIGTLTSGATSGANRGGTNPPTRPDPIPSVSHPCLSGNWGRGERPPMDALAPLAGVIA